MKMIEYLDESGASSEDGYAIPFAYKYDGGIFAKFKSLNDPESAASYASFKNHIKQGILGDLLNFGDTYVQMDLKNKLKLVYLRDTKIRGVLCSPNEQPGNPADKSERKISCKDTIRNLGSSISPGVTLTFRCPTGCG